MLFVCRKTLVERNSLIDVEVFGKSRHVAMLQLNTEDAIRIATELLSEAQRRIQCTTK